MNQLGDKPGDEPPKGPCLTRLPTRAAELCKALGLPPDALRDEDLRNDHTGFRAAMYRDESNGKLILVGRDTQPTSLVDWQTNTRNGEGRDTDQYAAMRRLSGLLTDELAGQGIQFDLAGYSKGGGLAQEAALVSQESGVYVFNSAGLHPNSLARTGATDFKSLESRTSAFNSEDEFLTYMNNTRDPDQQIANVEFLRAELAGNNRWLIDPMQIDHRNPMRPDGKEDPGFQTDLQAYMAELDQKIADMRRDRAEGRPLSAFPPVRAGQQETISSSMGKAGKLFRARSPGPNLGKLAQHQMENVVGPMEVQVEETRKALAAFVAGCGLLPEQKYLP